MISLLYSNRHLETSTMMTARLSGSH